MPLRHCFVLLVTLLMLTPVVLAPAAPSAGAAPLAAPAKLVLAFYYAWYDQNTWQEPLPDRPEPIYESADRATVQRHLGWAAGAGIDSLVLAWLGPNNPTDSNLTTLVEEARGSSVRASLLFETNSPFLGSQDAVVQALRYATERYTNDPGWLRLDGRPVIVFWQPRSVPLKPGQTPLTAWRQIRDQVDPNRTALWIGEGDDFSYLQVFDGIHPYSIAWSGNPAGTLASYAQRTRSSGQQLGTSKLWMATVMPGYDDRVTGRSGAFVRDREGGAYFRRTWEAALATDPDLIMITSFNEWIEGHAIEPCSSWGSLYLDITREYVGRFHAAPPPPTAAPPAPPAAPPAGAADYDLPSGHFFTQAGDAPGQGYGVTDEGGIPFWREFQRLGGVSAVGYPLTERINWAGFTSQVFQKAIFQWRPESGAVDFVNVFDDLSAAGKDEWLLEVRSTPRPLDAGAFDAGRSWDQVMKARLALLDTNSAIRARYFATADPVLFFGLPTSRVEDMGSHYAIRLQRAVIQQWKEDVPWARAGEVTVANGGDILREAIMR